MALRTAHGTSREHGGTVVVEVPPADELRALPGPPPGDCLPERPLGHRYSKGSPGTLQAAAKGGRTKAERARARAQFSALGLGDLATAPEFKTYIEDAEDFREEQARELSSLAGGVCGIGPSSMIATAALQVAASRYLFVLAGREKDSIRAAALIQRAVSAGDSSRQNILAAFHLAELEARSRGRARAARPGEAARAAADRAIGALEQQRAAEEIAAE